MLYFSPGLEECVTEDTVGLGRSIQGFDAVVKDALLYKTMVQGLFPDTFNHCRKGIACKTFNQVRSACIHIDHTGRDAAFFETRLDEQWKEFASNQGISPRLFLKLNLTMNRLVRVFTVRMEVCRTVIPFDYGDRTPLFDQFLQTDQGLNRVVQVLENKAYEDMIERLFRKWKMKDVSLLQRDIRDSLCINSFLRLIDRFLRYVDRNELSAGAVSVERDGLSANTTTRFQDEAPVGYVVSECSNSTSVWA